MSEEKFLGVMVGLFKIYNQPPDQLFVKMYWRFLKKYSIEQIKWAVSQYVEFDPKCEFMPRPGQLCKLIREVEQENLKEQAVNIWADIWDHITRTGNYCHPDPNVNEAVRRLGGWRNLRNMLENDYQRKCDLFIERYTEIFERQAKLDAQQHLGLHTQTRQIANLSV